jgi:hypothetical protein
MKTVTLAHSLLIFQVWASSSLDYQGRVPMSVQVMVFELGATVKHLENMGYG